MRRTARLLSCLLAFLLLRTADGAESGKDFVVETKHYTVTTDINQKYTEDTAELMESLFTAYDRVFRKIGGGISKRMVVRVCKTRDEYLKLVGRQYANSGGIFMPNRGMLATFLEGQGRSTLVEVLYHEGFHQFMAAKVGACPIWLNEGLAVLFQHSIRDGKSLDPKGICPRKLRFVQKAFDEGKAFSLRDLLLMSHAEWQKNMESNIRLGGLEYYESWLLIHFLAFGDGGRHQKNLNQYIMLIKQGTNPSDALTKAFGANYGAFEDRWRKYVKNLDPTPLLVCKENMLNLARLCMFYVKLSKKPVDDIQQFYADVMCEKYGGFDIPVDADTKVASSDVATLGKWFRCPCDKGGGEVSYRFAEDRAFEGPYPEIVRPNHGKIVLRAFWYVDAADGKRYPDVVEEEYLEIKSGKSG